MRISSIEPLITDEEINALADLFLCRYGFDVHSVGYRRLREAVILFSHDVWKPHDIYMLMGKHENVTAKAIVNSIRHAIDTLEDPIDVTFNSVYAQPVNGGASVTMSDSPDINYILNFLGCVFLYLVLTNHNTYEYIEYVPNDESETMDN